MQLNELLKRKWLILFAGWSIFGGIMAVQSYVMMARAGHPESFGLALERELVYAYFWALLTPYIIAFGRRFPFGPKIWLRNGMLHFFMGIAVSVFHKFCYHAIDLFIDGTHQHPVSFHNLFEITLSYIDYGALVYWTILLIDYSLAYYRESREQALRSARLESMLMQAQLQALKMQIRPHFLFNTLNAISVLIEKKPVAARQMLVRLSELLRMTLDREQTEEVSLAVEMDLIERYLQIEKTRFEDRLEIKLNMDETTMHASVPAMILQPLVENAMRHGAAKQRGSTMIEIRAERQNEFLHLSVRDNGPGALESELKEGIGLSNVRSRLKQLYGTRQTFEARNAAEGGFIAALAIPFHLIADTN